LRTAGPAAICDGVYPAKKSLPAPTGQVIHASSKADRLAAHTILPCIRAEAAQARVGTIETGHDLETIVVGNEPAVSGGFGSQVITHNDDGAM
jgi:hypothetical protein